MMNLSLLDMHFISIEEEDKEEYVKNEPFTKEEIEEIVGQLKNWKSGIVAELIGSGRNTYHDTIAMETRKDARFMERCSYTAVT